MVLSLVPSAFAAEGDAPQITATADKNSVKPGEKVTITYTLVNPVSQVTDLEIVLYYDNTLFDFVSSDISNSVWFKSPRENGVDSLEGDMHFILSEHKDGVDVVAGNICTITFVALDSVTDEKVAQFYNRDPFGTFLAYGNNGEYYPGEGIDHGQDDPIEVTISQSRGPVPISTEYGVSMGTNQQVAAGQQVRIPVTVASGKKGITGFNAYDMTFTYDPAALTLNTASNAAANLTVEDNEGTVRVRRYGATVPLGEALALEFTANKATSSTVTLTAAKFDLDANSINFDAPAVTITDADTTVKALWNVSLPDGFVSAAADGSTLVENGGDFTFKTTDTHYEYYLNITTNGATNMVKMDKATYTIKNVTDNVTVTVDNKIGKTYTIKFVAVDSTTTVEEDKATVADLVAYSTTTVQYPNDYQFTVKFPGTSYMVWPSVAPRQNTWDYVRQEDGAKLYTLSGASLVGDENNEITITLTKSKNYSLHNIVVTGSGADAFSENNALTFYSDENYTFTLNKSDYCDYTIAVWYEKPNSSGFGSTPVPMEYKDNGDGTYAIINMPTYDVTIRITKTAKTIDPDTVEVRKYLELNNKTVFMVRVLGSLSAYNNIDKTTSYIGFTYDGQRMYVPSYGGIHDGNAPAYKVDNGMSYSVYLVLLNKGETLTKEDAVAKLGVVTSTEQENKDQVLSVGADVNEDGIGGVGIDRRDVNDVQLIYDLYNRQYDSFETVNMRKFLKADVNGDCALNSQDAVKLAGEVSAG